MIALARCIAAGVFCVFGEWKLATATTYVVDLDAQAYGFIVESVVDSTTVVHGTGRYRAGQFSLARHELISNSAAGAGVAWLDPSNPPSRHLSPSADFIDRIDASAISGGEIALGRADLDQQIYSLNKPLDIISRASLDRPVIEQLVPPDFNSDWGLTPSPSRRACQPNELAGEVDNPAKASRTWRQFLENCTVPISLGGRADEQKFARIVGMLYLDTCYQNENCHGDSRYVPYCSAARISEDRILTAAHCVYNLEDDRRPYPASALRFVVAQDPKHLIAIASSPDWPSQPAAQRDDTVVLKITKPSKWVSPPEQIAFAAPARAQELMLGGAYLTAYFRLGFLPPERASTDSEAIVEMKRRAIAEGGVFRLDKGATCVVGYVTPDHRCLYTGCQDDRGNSGGPLFDANATIPTIVGVDNGNSRKRNTGDCDEPNNVEMYKWTNSGSATLGIVPVSLLGSR
jgi:hypothetical protein